MNTGADPWNQRVFANVTKLYNGMFYIMADYASSYGVLYPMPHAPFERYLAALETGTLQQYEYTDADGTYLEAAVPVKNTAGETVAVLYVGSSKDDLVLLQDVFRAEVIRDTAIAAAALMLVIAAVSVFLLLSIRRLRWAVKRMEGGDLDTAVAIRSRDEIGDLGQGFNAMGRRLKATFDEITTMSSAYKRFVPQEFLQLLGKEKIAEIELKQNRLLNLTILFADIRSFTALSETMGPEDNFRFLNSYLSRMGPIIRAHHGFIDKYLGDGIMALFPGEPADAVRAAVAMQQELYTYNAQRRRMSYPPIGVGIGVHSEKVILGIVGEQERMEGTVIGNAVNLASRLESLTKRYKARIIVSDEVMRSLGKDGPEHRYLGDAKVKGKAVDVPVHEVFTADPPEDVRLKRRSKAFFETGVGLFRQAQRHSAKDLFAEASRYFRAVRKAHDADLAAAYYVEECAKAFAQSPAPEPPDEA